MPLRNGDHGYGAVTKTLHWLTVFAIIGQFLVGWTMEGDDEAFDRGKDRIGALENAGKDRAKEQGDAAEDLLADGVSLPEIRVLLGLQLMPLGLMRVSWRAAAPLPPWAPYLRPGERRLEAALEKLLLALLFVVPGTGLLLIATGGDWLAAHIAAQLILLAVIAVHIGLVLGHPVVRRDGQLRRML